MTSRGSSYSASEDVLLCEVYTKISRNSVTGVYVSKDQFWSRVEDEYNRSKRKDWNARNKRSLQCRVQIMEKAVRKLCSCIKQVENTNPHDGASSDQDILIRAKRLLMEDVNYKRGFKFDHVWNMVKNFDKFKDNVLTAKQYSRKHRSGDASSESDNLSTPESNVPISPGFSSSSNHDVCDSSYEKPTGAKKAKLKRKAEEKFGDCIDMLRDQNLEIMKLIMKANSEHLEKSLALKELIRDDKILMLDLNTISNLTIRAHFQAQQKQILQKRGFQYQQS